MFVPDPKAKVCTPSGTLPLHTHCCEFIFHTHFLFFFHFFFFRNARKQKYKELYQNEREKCVYLQKHYYEELEKKNEEIERKDQEIERKDHKLERFQQRIKFLEVSLACVNQN